MSVSADGHVWRREFTADGPRGRVAWVVEYEVLTARHYLEHVASVQAAEDDEDDERHIEAVVAALGVMVSITGPEGERVDPPDLPLALIGEVYAAHPAFKSL